MNTQLRDKMIRRLDQTQGGSGVVLLGSMKIARHEVEGRHVFFAVTHPNDTIQGTHARTGFYEPEELEIIRGAFRKGGRFVDIGANVGNHSIFVGLFLAPGEIVAIEPNPVVYKLFINNMLLNGLDPIVDMSFLGMGMSETASDGFGMNFRERNIGGGRMAEGKGDIATIRGDDMIGDRRADFIKIDVEGMEMQVLRSLEATVTRDHPRIFIEVDNENRADFDAWVEAHGYRKAADFKRYKTNENFLLIHESDDFDG
ncbi:MAG: FkbM family methyltransferase [Pseudomonadota bacterium]